MMEETTCKPDYSNSMAEHLGIRFLPSTEDAVHAEMPVDLSLIHISEPTRQAEISYAVFCLKKKKKNKKKAT